MPTVACAVTRARQQVSSAEGCSHRALELLACYAIAAIRTLAARKAQDGAGDGEERGGGEGLIRDRRAGRPRFESTREGRGQSSNRHGGIGGTWGGGGIGGWCEDAFSDGRARRRARAPLDVASPSRKAGIANAHAANARAMAATRRVGAIVLLACLANTSLSAVAHAIDARSVMRALTRTLLHRTREAGPAISADTRAMARVAEAVRPATFSAVASAKGAVRSRKARQATARADGRCRGEVERSSKGHGRYGGVGCSFARLAHTACRAAAAPNAAVDHITRSTNPPRPADALAALAFAVAAASGVRAREARAIGALVAPGALACAA